MYIPKPFVVTDEAEILAFMQQYSFATIVTTGADGVPVANHLPFVVEKVGDDIILSSHFAKANPQAAELDKPILVIFTEPHAYISPSHYEKVESVPTWNYMAVHAYGKAITLNGKDEQLMLMEKMIRFYDAAYLEQWNGLPDDFKTKMLNGIVAFMVKVTSLQAKNKLSQNRSETDRETIIKVFEHSKDSNEVAIAEYMKKGM
jgi:transcriptional regulator